MQDDVTELFFSRRRMLGRFLAIKGQKIKFWPAETAKNQKIRSPK